MKDKNQNNNSLSQKDKELLSFIGKKLVQNDEQWFKDNAINVKDTGKYFVLNYDQIAAYVIGVNEYNKLTRGTVFDKSGNVVSLPFKRFFNYGEEQADRLDFSKSQIIEKLDGSLLSVFFDENNNPVYNTRKMISSSEKDMSLTSKALLGDDEVNLMQEFGKYVKDVNFERAKKALGTNNVVFIFEAITSKNKVVTSYAKDALGLYLIGCRIMDTLEELTEEELDSVATLLNVKRPKIYSFTGNYKEIKKMLDDMDQFSEDFEGFVVRQADKRVKIKKDSYLKLHKTIGNISYKSILPIVLSGETEELRAYQNSPDAIKIIDDIEDKLDKLTLSIIDEWKRLEEYTNIPGAGSKSAKKQFVQAAKEGDPRYFDFMMAIYDGKIDINNMDVEVRRRLEGKSIDKVLKLLRIKDDEQ